MAEALPNLVPTYPVTTSQPIHGLSQGQVEAPFRDMAEALDKSGAALSDVATGLAEKAGEEAGRKSVRTADDGSLIVDKTGNPFIIGDAGKAYERAAKIAQAAQLEPQIQTDILNLRLKNPNNPAGFQAAAKAYSDGILNGDPDSNRPGIQDPHIRGAVSDMLTHQTQQNLRSSLVETNQQNTAEAQQTYQARIKDLNEQLSDLARQGGVDTPEYKQKALDRATLWHELGADPRFKFSPVRADLEMKAAFSEDTIQAVIGKVQRQYLQDKDLAKAKQTLENEFVTGPNASKLSLTMVQKERGVAEGIKSLSVLTAQDSEAISFNKGAVDNYVNSLIHNPKSFDQGMYGNMLQRSHDIGDFKSQHYLEDIERQLPIWQDLQSSSGPEQADKFAQMRAALVPSGAISKIIDQEAKRVGLPPEWLQSYARIESSGNPNANRGLATQYKGLFQLNAEELNKYGGGDIFNPADNARAAANGLRAKYDAFQDKYGRPPTQTELYLTHQQGEAGLGALLAHPNRPAWESIRPFYSSDHMAKAAIGGNVPYDMRFRFGGVENVSGQDFVNIWQHKVERTLVPGQHLDLTDLESPTTKLWQSTLKEQQKAVDRHAEDTFNEIRRIKETGGALQSDTAAYFGRLVTLSDNEELARKAEPLLNAINQQNNEAPGTSVTAMRAEQARMQADGTDTVAQLSHQYQVDWAAASEKRLNADPLIEGANKAWIGPIGTLDPSQPQNFGAAMADRNHKIGVVQQYAPQLGPISALSSEEEQRVATQLTQGPTQTASALFDAMHKNLTPENLQATMASGPIRDAVSAMAMSNDPGRMTAGMMELDRMYSANASEFNKTYGGDTKARLLAWKTMAGMTPEFQVERLNRADNTNTAKSREDLAKEVEDQYRNYKPADVAYELGSAWPITPGFISRAIGSTPAAPLDELQAGEMKHEFIELSKDVRAHGGMGADQTRALVVQDMKSRWQTTRLIGAGTGQTLMKYAPESYYPMIDGGHEWMQKDLDDFVGKVYGEKLAGVGEGFIPGWSIRGIVSDAQTEQEIQRGQSPSYRIHIMDAKGQDQFVRDPVTGQDRIRWNAGSAMEAARQRMQPRFQGADQLPKGITGPM